MEDEANMFPKLLGALRGAVGALSKHESHVGFEDAEPLSQAREVLADAESLNLRTRQR